MTKRMDPCWKYSLGYYPGKLRQPSKAGQYSSPGNTENTAKIFLKESNPKAHKIIRFTRVEMKEKMLSAARETQCRSLSRNPTSQKRVGANIQHP